MAFLEMSHWQIFRQSWSVFAKVHNVWCSSEFWFNGADDCLGFGRSSGTAQYVVNGQGRLQFHQESVNCQMTAATLLAAAGCPRAEKSGEVLLWRILSFAMGRCPLAAVSG
jgi:hypothetical protein